MQNILLLVFFVAGYLLMAMLAWILLRWTPNYGPKNLAATVSKSFFLDYPQLRSVSSKVSTIFAFFNLFLFINLLVLSCSIKTDKLLINTGKEILFFESPKVTHLASCVDEIIDSLDKLAKTDKILTFYKGLRLTDSF